MSHSPMPDTMQPEQEAAVHAQQRPTTTHDGRPRHQNEHGAREPVMAPEADIALARPEPKAPEAALVPPAEPTLMPPPLPMPKAPPQAAAELPVAASEQVEHLIIDHEMMQRAEQKLAEYVGEHIDARLTEGLVLNLKEHAADGKAGIELCFQGPHLVENSALMGEQVLAALKQHPAFAKLYQHANSTPRAVKPHEAEKVDMMHIHAGHLSTHDYATLIRDIAIGIQVEPKHAQIIKEATGTAVKPKQPANDDTVAQSVPQTVIQKPVAALEKAVNDNEIAPQGVAL